MDTLLVERRDGVVTVTLNRPEKKNAVNDVMWNELLETFRTIFARRGLSVDLGGSWVLPRLVGLHKAKELVLFADILDAKEAQDLGLVNRVVPAAQLDAFVEEWAARLAAGPPVALSMSKR